MNLGEKNLEESIMIYLIYSIHRKPNSIPLKKFKTENSGSNFSWKSVLCLKPTYLGMILVPWKILWVWNLELCIIVWGTEAPSTVAIKGPGSRDSSLSIHILLEKLSISDVSIFRLLKALISQAQACDWWWQVGVPFRPPTGLLLLATFA